MGYVSPRLQRETACEESIPDFFVEIIGVVGDGWRVLENFAASDLHWSTISFDVVRVFPRVQRPQGEHWEIRRSFIYGRSRLATCGGSIIRSVVTYDVSTFEGNVINKSKDRKFTTRPSRRGEWRSVRVQWKPYSLNTEQMDALDGHYPQYNL